MGSPVWKTTYRAMRHGSKMTAGLGVSQTQIRVALKSLQSKGLIHPVVSGARGLTLAINLAWRPQASEYGCAHASSMDVALPGEHHEVISECDEGGDTPSEVRGGVPRKAEGVSLGNPWDIKEEPSSLHHEGSTTSLLVRVRERPVTSASGAKGMPTPKRLSDPAAPAATAPAGGLPTAPAAPVSADLFGAVSARLAPRTAPKVNWAAVRKIAKPGSLMQTWRHAFEETFADVKGAIFTPPTHVELGKLKSALIAKWQGTTEEMHDLIDFSVTNWAIIRETTFAWMTKSPAPVFPDLGFFIRRHLDFRAVWSRRTHDDWLNSLPLGEHRRLLELTTREGLSREAALAKIGEERAKYAMREENDRIRQEAKDDKRTALIALRQADRRPVYTAENPHPRSAAALGEVPRRRVTPDLPEMTEGEIESFLSFKCPEWRDDL